MIGGVGSQDQVVTVYRAEHRPTPSETGELRAASAVTVRVQLHGAHAALRDSILETEHA